MDKTTLYLTPELSHRLRATARRDGRSQAEIIREAIDRYLQDTEEPDFASLGMADYGELDAADIDAWLEENWRPE